MHVFGEYAIPFYNIYYPFLFNKGEVIAPTIIRAHPLYYDVATGAAAYNLSWNPPMNPTFNIDFYEVTIGGLNQSTRDTHLIFSVEPQNNSTINISVTIVDRCKRRASTIHTLKIPSMITAGNQPC